MAQLHVCVQPLVEALATAETLADAVAWPTHLCMLALKRGMHMYDLKHFDPDSLATLKIKGEFTKPLTQLRITRLLKLMYKLAGTQALSSLTSPHVTLGQGILLACMYPRTFWLQLSTLCIQHTSRCRRTCPHLCQQEWTPPPPPPTCAA